MNILILNGNSVSSNESFNHSLTLVKECMVLDENKIEILNLANLKIHFCSGCFSCWWKTPGICMFKDDMLDIYKKFLQSDFVLFASPLVKGHETALIKKVKDRLIPLLHPDMEIRDKECHHIKRYEKYPTIGFVYQKEDDTDDEDIAIVHDIQKRYALNFHAELKIFKSIDTPVNKIAHAITNN